MLCALFLCITGTVFLIPVHYFDQLIWLSAKLLMLDKRIMFGIFTSFRNPRY